MIGWGVAFAGARKVAAGIPREVWFILAGILALWYSYHLGYKAMGKECIEENRKAVEAAAIEAVKQEVAAPVIAQEAAEAVQPIIEERVIYVNKNNRVSCDEPYADELQSEIRKAEAAIDRMRSAGTTKDGKADD